jgi:hypothetical protein
MTDGLKRRPFEFPPGWKPPKPPPSQQELRDLVEGSINEMGLRGPEAAAFRQRYRRWLGPYYPKPVARPRDPIPLEKAEELAAKVGDQLGLDMEFLKQNMGLTKRGTHD